MTFSDAGEVPPWTLADRLRKAREHAHLTQQELADSIGISRASVSNYEMGRHTPSRPVLLSWAMVCDVRLEWLAGSPHPGLTIVRDGRGIRKPGRWTPVRGLAATTALVAIALSGGAA